MNFDTLSYSVYPMMGIFNLTVEEKIASWIIETYHPLGVFTEYNKSELNAMVKPLLGMYQEGVLQEEIPVYDDTNAMNVEDVENYLYTRSQLPSQIVTAFLNGLWELTQSGTLELKHLDPTEKKTTAVTTKILPTVEDIKEATPKLLTSVLDVDLPSFIQKNLLTIGIVGTGIIATTVFLKGARYGRTA